MSNIEGLDGLLDTLRRLDGAMGEALDAALLDELKKTQEEAADLVPVDSGRGREILMLPEAIRKRKDRQTGQTLFEFGFLTARMRASKPKGGAFYLFFVEFGTKSRAAGELLFPGLRDRRSKSGRQRRARRRKRGSPARPAQPFFRPAKANLLRRLNEGRGLSAIVSAALKAAKDGAPPRAES